MGVKQTSKWLFAVTSGSTLACCLAGITIQLIWHFYDDDRPAGVLYWPFLILSVLGLLCTGLLAVVSLDILRLNPADNLPFATLRELYVMIRKTYYYGPGTMQRFLSGCADVDAVQEKYLLKLINHNKDTVYGKDHKFEEINSIKDFQKQHPVVRHKDIKPYIDRIAEGEKNILTKDNPMFFAKSSGTTGAPKLVPVTKYLTDDQIQDMTYSFTYMPVPMGIKLTLGKTVVLGHKPQVDTTKSGLLAAPLTFFYTRPSPAYTSPKQIYSITHENTAFYIHAIFALQEREVTNLRLMFAYQAYSFFTFLEEHWQTICSDIECGTLTRQGLTIDDGLYDEILQLMKPNCQRAQELRKEFSNGNVYLAKRLWPMLEYCYVTTTGSMAVYGELIEKTCLKGVILFQNGYGASEGLYGLNLQTVTQDSSYILAYSYAFYEFIPEDNIEEKNPETVLAHEVKPGHNYELILTNGSGLCRYRSEDVVKITQMIEKCPVMEFQYRAGQVLNLLGEKMTDTVFYKALCNATKKLGVTLIDYTTCEDIHLHDISDIDKYVRHYVLFIELNKKLSDKDTEQFDESLCQESSVYAGMLKNRQSVTRMQVIQVKAGSFLQLKDRMIKESQNPQFKMPRALRVKPHLAWLLQQKLQEST